MNAWLTAFTDNPIIVKHLRSRLRLSQFLPVVIGVLSLCVLSAYIGYMGTGVLAGGQTARLLSFLAFIVLGLFGSHQVAMALGTAKESGILDFHRVSPQPPPSQTVGFLLGAPVREYAVFALILPFIALGVAQNESIGWSGLIGVVGWVPITAWMTHSLAMVIALTSKKPRWASGGVIGLTLMTLWIGTGVYSAFRGARIAFSGEETDPGGLPFFGYVLPTTLFLLIYEGTFAALLLIAATRKIRAERALPFSKPQALVGLAAVITLGLGAAWGTNSLPGLTVGLLYLFVLAGIVFAATVTPYQGEYTKGVRRALRAGHRRAPILADSASNAWAVYGLAGLVALGATIAWEAIDGGFAQAETGRASYSQTIAVGAFTVAYYGLGKQFFALRFGRKGEIYFRLFLFMIWIVPLLGGVAAGVAGLSNKSVQIAMGLSPWAGMILSIKGLPITDAEAAEVVRFMALLPSLAFAFLFNFMLTNQQRRIDRELRTTQKPNESHDMVALT